MCINVSYLGLLARYVSEIDGFCGNSFSCVCCVSCALSGVLDSGVVSCNLWVCVFSDKFYGDGGTEDAGRSTE